MAFSITSRYSPTWPGEEESIKAALSSLAFVEDHTQSNHERGYSVKLSQFFLGLIVLGLLALVIGILLFAHLFGTHHLLPPLALAAGAILIIGGVVGMMVAKRKSPA